MCHAKPERPLRRVRNAGGSDVDGDGILNELDDDDDGMVCPMTSTTNPGVSLTSLQILICRGWNGRF